MAEARMFTDIRVRREAPDHIKVLKLSQRLKGDAFGSLVRLWNYAAGVAPDTGNLGPMSYEDLGTVSKWNQYHPESGPEDFGRAVVEVGLVDQFADGSMGVHDWSEGQGFLASAPTRIELARAKGKASAEARRKKYGSAQPSRTVCSETPEPARTGCSGNPEPTPNRCSADPRTGPNSGPDRTGPDHKSGPSPSVSRESPGSSPSPSPLPSATASASASSPESIPPKTRRARAATKLHIRRGMAILQGKPDPGPPTPEQIESLAATMPPGEDDPEYQDPAVCRGG